MIKRVTDIINLLLFGTGKKNSTKQKSIHLKSKTYQKNFVKPKKSKLFKIDSTNTKNVNNTNFKERIGNFFSRKRNATPEKKLFMKWLQNNKGLSKDPKEIEKLFTEYLNKRERILNFEETSFKKHH